MTARKYRDYLEIVWDTIKRDIPDVKPKIERALREISEIEKSGED
jgi:uncharacterized protein with HEPN domain